MAVSTASIGLFAAVIINIFSLFHPKRLFPLNYGPAQGWKRQHLQVVLAEWRIIVWQPKLQTKRKKTKNRPKSLAFVH